MPLAEDEVREAARELKDEGVDSIAICFLFSYINPGHEKRAARSSSSVCPERVRHHLGAVSPQFREFERFTTTAMNAFIGPLVRNYVAGSTALGTAGSAPNSTSWRRTAAWRRRRMVSDARAHAAVGPRRGRARRRLGGRARRPAPAASRFDVGGTSADIGVVTDGRFGEATARDTWIAGYPILVPMIDIHTIGAGGGWIAHVDAGGAFRVGPQSAGAVPGPAAYGRGGTDADGDGRQHRAGPARRARTSSAAPWRSTRRRARAIAALAGRLGLAVLEAAEGVVTVLNSNMANAIRSRTVQKGIDPRDFALVAFGGAGPLHGAEVAAMLGIPEVVVPPYPGITSAIGLLTTDLKYDEIRTEFQVSGAVDLARMNATSRAWSGARRQFAADGVAPGEVAFTRWADLRYVGQGYELRVPVPEGAIDAAALAGAWQRFHGQHEAEYGHCFPASPIEIVNIRVTGVGRMPKIGAAGRRAATRWPPPWCEAGPCVFRVRRPARELETAFYRRDRLPLDQPFAGPAIILQTTARPSCPRAGAAVADRHGNLLIARRLTHERPRRRHRARGAEPRRSRHREP